LGYVKSERAVVFLRFSCFRTDFRHVVGRNAKYPCENLIVQSNAVIGTNKIEKKRFVRFANSDPATRVRAGWHGYLDPTVRSLEVHVE
jgi:NADH:ubiquinone oxidoreductase subunit